MKHTEIVQNIRDIATDVFRDTQVLFAYLYPQLSADIFEADSSPVQYKGLKNGFD